MQHAGKGMLAGLAATVVLSLIMVMKSAMGLMPQLDVIGMLSAMAGAPAMRTIGWLAHFAIGTVLWGILFAWLEPRLPGGPTASGLIFATGAWLAMMVLLMPMAGQGLFGLAIGWIAPVTTLMLHWIFGAVLGWTYGKLTEGEPERAERHRGERDYAGSRR